MINKVRYEGINEKQVGVYMKEGGNEEKIYQVKQD